MSIKITCINKDSGNHDNPNLAITHLGWINDVTGNTGITTRLDLYDFIKKGNYVYVERLGNKVKVITAETTNGTKYVKTESDSTTNNNLLSLPEC